MTGRNILGYIGKFEFRSPAFRATSRKATQRILCLRYIENKMHFENFKTRFQLGKNGFDYIDLTNWIYYKYQQADKLNQFKKGPYW